MPFIYPLISVLGESFGKITDKFAFNKTNVKPTQLLFLNFLVMFFGITIFILFLGDSLPEISGFFVFLMLTIVVISLYQNIFYARSVKFVELSFRETIVGIRPIVVGSIAFALFPDERQLKYLIGLFVGSLILYFGNKRKHHKFELNKGVVYILISILLSAILNNIYKFGLETISPNFIFLFRIGGILLLLIFYKHGNRMKGLDNKAKKLGLLSGLFYLFGSLAVLYSIEHMGLNMTVLLLMLEPALVYLFSFTLLKEKFNLRRIVMSVLILSLVLIVSYI